jgi:hypothetical protein
LLIYLQNISPRLKYIISFLSRYYNCEVNFTNDVNEYSSFKGIRINYSSQLIIDDEVWIKPGGLLFENNVHSFQVHCKKHREGFLILFPSDNDFGFDILSAIFFLISRYEEYLPHKKDMYGRYAHENSIAFQYKFHQLPLVNIWLEYLKNVVQSKTGQHINGTKFKFQPTYDIDIAWSYKNKGVLRNAGGMLKSIKGLKFKEVQERIAVLSGKENDPHDAYQWMEDLHIQFNLKPIYFFHVGLKKSIYDKNISAYKMQMQKLIISIAERNEIGLHPSWISGDKEEALENEKKLLETIVKKNITSSRQHYIRLSFPESYRSLIKTGIRDDYSMGYGSINGFRASITTSFYWYDLEKEEQTELLLHPFCFMDANSYYEQNQTADQTFIELNHYLSEVKKVNGTLITIWHNNFLGTDPTFDGWKQVYEQFLQKL